MYTQTHTHNVYYYNISQVFEVMGILVQALLLLQHDKHWKSFH